MWLGDIKLLLDGVFECLWVVEAVDAPEKHQGSEGHDQEAQPAGFERFVLGYFHQC